MKKRLSMLLAASAAVSLLLAGCGGNSEPSEDKNSEEKVNTESNDTQKKEEEEKESGETVADGTLNSLGLPSAYIRKLFVGNENDFYVWMSQSDLHEIKHYTYDRDMPSVQIGRAHV